MIDPNWIIVALMVTQDIFGRNLQLLVVLGLGIWGILDMHEERDKCLKDKDKHKSKDERES